MVNIHVYFCFWFFSILTFFKKTLGLFSTFCKVVFLGLMDQYPRLKSFFLCSQARNFSWIWQFVPPKGPHWKIRSFLATSCIMTLPKVSNFYNLGLWDNSLSFVGSNWHFAPDQIKKNDTCQVRLARNNKLELGVCHLPGFFQKIDKGE